MPWKERSVVEERMRFVLRLSSERSVKDLFGLYIGKSGGEGGIQSR
jgi:hypothetical protein